MEQLGNVLILCRQIIFKRKKTRAEMRTPGFLVHFKLRSHDLSLGPKYVHQKQRPITTNFEFVIGRSPE
jgi:hypothetical protein